MGYRGKSAAATALALLIVYAAYFGWALERQRSAGAVLAYMAGTIILVAILATGFEIFIYVWPRRMTSSERLTDERDKLIAARGARNGYYAFLSLVWVTPIMLLMGVSSVLVANCLLAMIVVAEIVHFGSRAFYDARGA